MAYIIKYKSDRTSDSGTHAYISKGFAEKYARILNQEYPKMTHFVCNAPPNTPIIEIKNYDLNTLQYK